MLMLALHHFLQKFCLMIYSHLIHYSMQLLYRKTIRIFCCILHSRLVRYKNWGAKYADSFASIWIFKIQTSAIRRIPLYYKIKTDKRNHRVIVQSRHSRRIPLSFVVRDVIEMESLKSRGRLNNELQKRQDPFIGIFLG